MLNNFRNMLCHGNVIYNFKYFLLKENNLSIIRFYEKIFNLKCKSIKLSELIITINLFNPHHDKNNKMIELYNKYIIDFLNKIDDEGIKNNFKQIFNLQVL